MSDGGLHDKFRAERIDPEAQGRHKDCFLFVLDPAHDRAAFFALTRYAEVAIKRGQGQLGEELFAKLEEMNQAYDYRTEEPGG